MDKYKTSEMGKALKKVFRGEMQIQDSVELAVNEISRYFQAPAEVSLEEDRDIGFFGDVVGLCPICRAEVKRNKFGYGCSDYKSGCKFSVSSYICGRAISTRNVKMLLEEGKTSKIKGFTSKNGKSFDAVLKIADGRCVFDFGDPSPTNIN